ncbi:hypothetical protein VA7868_04284 [Vibrio aerogenes CECT 7868]|uniref:Uncharacterized protein n=1 Tax=Vibrio aerogenes CECT 7868 TaxID=1216006 RepID=A0A1M6DPC8_9VIBR|nr:hypothetical protein [Vibrio aerogenes]SHI75061.1 hypothetical protein VA7868_04284 [Vibrio aerogenes CECT 7868]
MKSAKYVLIPLLFTFATSAFAGEWTDKLTVTSVSEYIDPQTGGGDAEVSFKSSPTTTACPVTAKSLTIAKEYSDEYSQKMSDKLTKALTHHKKVQVYTDCRYGDAAIYGVKITNDFAL